MSKRPIVRFFLADRRHPVRPREDGWSRCLPRARTSVGRRPDINPLTYGDYFEAVSRFLDRDGWAGVNRAGVVLDPNWPAGEALCRIDIFLEKHGAFYHPCRVLAVAGGRRIELVVNVAASPEGQKLLPVEVGLLDTLARRFGLGCLPAVFDSGSVALADGRRLDLFLGQWFSDFCEFHLTGPADGPAALAVWTPEGPHLLDAPRRQALYRQAAALLTGYYDVFSGEQILDWQHAAGDFVVRIDDGGLPALRLVTVRRYGPLIRDGAADLETALEALALFLVHTSVWMRLDRCDGVGDLMLSGVETLDAVVDGVFEALERKVARGEMPAAMLTAAAADLGAWKAGQIAELIMALAARRPEQDPTRGLLARTASAHAGRLQAALIGKTRPYLRRRPG